MAEKSVYLIYGDDDYLVGDKAGKLVKELVPAGDSSFGLDVVDGAAATVEEALNAVGECIAAMQSMGLFSADKLVWFKNVNFLSDTRTGKSEAVKSELSRLADMIKAGLPPGVKLVITAEKADKRKAFYKACKSAGELHEFNLPDVSRKDGARSAGAMLDSVLVENGIKLKGGARGLFLAKVGGNTRHMVNEAEKLALYVGKGGVATVDHVQAIVSASTEAAAWDLEDAFGKRKLTEALNIMRQLLFQKESPIRLVVGLEGRIRDLMLYRDALDRGWIERSSGWTAFKWGDVGAEADELFGDCFERDPRKIHPFRVGLLAEQAIGFSRKRLQYCLEKVTEAHATLVSSRVPQEMVLELLLVRMLVGIKRRGAKSR